MTDDTAELILADKGESLPHWLCPRCKRRERENFGDGDWGAICVPCADADYERYKERADFDYWHRDEPRT